MEFLKKILSLLVCFLMALAGPVLSSALADGYGNTASSEAGSSAGGQGGAPCRCCNDGLDNRRGSGGKRTFFYNGSEYHQKTDLALPGIMPIQIQRTYNNQATFDSPLGYGWDFSFNDRLRTYSDNSVVIRTTTGTKLHFIFTGGIYVCEESPHVTLENNPDGSFVFYASPTGSRYYYDREGRLTIIQNISGESLKMSYSTDLKPLIGTSPNSITPDTPMVVSYNYQLLNIEEFDKTDSSTGRYVNFTYDGSSGRLTSVVDSTSRTIGYQHDTLGNLTRIDYPEGLFIAYEYTDPNDSHNMTNNLRGYGANAAVLQTARQYDTDDRMIREEYAGGVLEIDHTIPLQKTTVTRTIVDDQGTTLHEFDTVYEFNTQGYLIQTTDEQKSLELVRDSRNNVIEKQIYLNTGSVSYPTLTLESSVFFAFDIDNNLIGSVTTLEDGEEIQTTTSYDNGLITEQLLYSNTAPDRIHQTILEYNYDAGLPTTVANINILKSNSPVPVYDTVSFQYNDNNQPTEILYDTGDTITMEYEDGLLSKREDTSFSYDNRGNVTAFEDANGNTTHYEYDTLGRMTKVINPLAEETVFTYTGWNRTRVELSKTTTLPGRIFNFSHDNFGRLIQSSVLDSGNSPVQQTTYSYNSDGHVLAVEDQLGNKKTNSYDQWGRIVSTKDKDGNTTLYENSITGRIVKVTNPLLQSKTYEYDKLERLIKNINSVPASGTTSYYYDEVGKVVKVVDAESREFTFGYDLAGQLVWEKSPASDIVRYEYDSKGRLSKKLLPDGTYNTYTYNSKNKMEEAYLAAGTPSSTILRYGYDKIGNLLWYSDSSMGLEPQFSLSYDQLNRLISKTLVDINKTIQLTYTPQGQRARLTLLDGENELFHYSYSYDTAGRPLSLVQEQQSIIWSTGFTFDDMGLLISKNYSNGVAEALTYTPGGLLGSIHYETSDSTEIEQFQYTHDPLGRITGITDTQGTATFSYDMRNRLLTSDYPSGSNLTDESFTYDLTGNRLTSAAITDWSYDEGGKLKSYDGHSLSYDIMGRQTGVSVGTETKTYDYDTLDRVTRVQSGGSTSNYQYDYTNRRIKKTVDSSSIWYLYDGANLIAEFDQSGQLTRNYAYTPDNYDLLSITEGNVSYSILTNHHKMPVYALDDNENSLWQGVYQSFGRAVIDNDTDGDGTSFEISHRFPGQYSDAETGLYYNWFRSYNAETGRYISVDPIKLAGGVNLFSYVQNNPINLIDPDGLLGFHAHFLITFAAALNSDMSLEDSFRLAEDAMMVDFVDGSGGQDIAGTRQHLMAGTIDPEGKIYQTREEAIAYGRAYIHESLRYGNLYRGVHAGQDLATPLHRGERWDGGFHWDFESFVHIWEDVFPDGETVLNAYNNTTLMINNSWEEDKLFNDRRIRNRQNRQDCHE